MFEAFSDLPSVDWRLLGAAAVVFGIQRLVPTYKRDWYVSLKKPSWNPPNWVFPAVWIPLKCMQSVALWAVWKAGASPLSPETLAGLAAFAIHLGLGNYWNVVFFGQHEMKKSVKVMAAFWASIATTIATFSLTSPASAQLMAPTLAWVTVAAKLNYDIVKLNENKDDENKDD